VVRADGPGRRQVDEDGAGLIPDATYRRRRAATSLIRAAFVTVVLLVVYYQAPLDRPVDLRLALWLVGGLVVLGTGVTWQARMIATSETPRLQAIETAAVALPGLIVLYVSVYAVMSHDHPASFSEVLGRTGALYYTMTVFATVGFGDITPMTKGTRIVTMTQMVVGLLAVGLAAKLLVGAVQEAVTRAAAAERPPGDPRRGR
jgi:voltage-gated potassium channel